MRTPTRPPLCTRTPPDHLWDSAPRPCPGHFRVSRSCLHVSNSPIHGEVGIQSFPNLRADLGWMIRAPPSDHGSDDDKARRYGPLICWHCSWSSSQVIVVGAFQITNVLQYFVRSDFLRCWELKIYPFYPLLFQNYFGHKVYRRDPRKTTCPRESHADELYET